MATTQMREGAVDEFGRRTAFDLGLAVCNMR